MPRGVPRAKVTLGRRYRDTITGFEGTVTARHEYLYGCVRYQLEGRANGEGKPEEYVFDEQRLVEAKTEEKPSARATSGGARPTPSRAAPRR